MSFALFRSGDRNDPLEYKLKLAISCESYQCLQLVRALPLIDSVSRRKTDSSTIIRTSFAGRNDRKHIRGASGVSLGERGNDISDTDATCSPFRPFYPSNSPYVTSVSSTFLSPNYLPVCQSNLIPSLPIICQQMGEIAVGVSQGIFWTVRQQMHAQADTIRQAMTAGTSLV
jgi:hypothetical protein